MEAKCTEFYVHPALFIALHRLDVVLQKNARASNFVYLNKLGAWMNLVDSTRTQAGVALLSNADNEINPCVIGFMANMLVSRCDAIDRQMDKMNVVFDPTPMPPLGVCASRHLSPNLLTSLRRACAIDKDCSDVVRSKDYPYTAPWIELANDILSVQFRAWAAFQTRMRTNSQYFIDNLDFACAKLELSRSRCRALQIETELAKMNLGPSEKMTTDE